MLIAYNIIYTIYVILYLPILILRGRWHKGMIMRFGKFHSALINRLKGKNNIWIHAVSVGEVYAVLGLINKLRKQYPGSQIVLSTVTKTGYELAESHIVDFGCIIYAPLDLPIIIDHYLNIIQPQIYITAETEIWPNLFNTLKKCKVKIIQINGRISDKSFSRYSSIKTLLKPTLDCVETFCMQSELDAKRIMSLGAGQNNVQVVGNIKFDDLDETSPIARNLLGLQENAVVIIGGSTHSGEEKVLLEIYCRLKNDLPQIRLILAPRHIERTEEVINLVKSSGQQAKKFSESGDSVDDSIIVVDTIGQLRSLYSLADIVFIGKSLTGRGGQNILEPAYFGNTIFVGPYVENFKNIVDLFLLEKALIQVKDKDELYHQFRNYIDNPQKRNDIGALASQVVKRNQGASLKTLDIIKQILPY